MYFVVANELSNLPPISPGKTHLPFFHLDHRPHPPPLLRAMPTSRPSFRWQRQTKAVCPSQKTLVHSSSLATYDLPPSSPLFRSRKSQLPYRVRWQDLKDLFRKAGTVLRADVSLGPDNRSRGYGTVLLATAEDATRAVEMFHGYNWQTRTLEVRPDRIAQDFEGPNSTLASPGGFHSPGNSVFPLVICYRTLDRVVSVTGPLYPSLPPQSIPTIPTNPEDFLALSRPTTATASRNLFVGNVSTVCLTISMRVNLFPSFPSTANGRI